KKLGVVALDPSHSQITSNLETLTTAVSEAQIAKILAASRYRVLTEMNPDALDQTVANAGENVAASHLSALRSERDTDTAQLAQLTAQKGLGPQHPKVLALNAQIAELGKQIKEEQTRVLAQAKQTLIAREANESSTRAALDAEKTVADKLRDDLVDYSIAQREYESERSLYEGLLERLRTATVQAGLESTEIEIVDQAIPPSSASIDSRSSLVVLNALAGAVIGIILAFILESLDTGLRSVADIETVSGLPSLALIPRSRRAGVDVSSLTLAQRNLGTLLNPKSQFTEAFRALRTSLLLSTAGGSPRVILMTSATPSEGKTTVSANLACVMAQNNARVLLIDGDLRRPTIHHRLGLNGKIGLTSVLTGSTRLEDAVQHMDEVPTLDILVSGPVPPFPTEMLGSQTMVDLLEHAKTIYTHIIIDSPPLLSVTDGVVMASMSDAVMLIVRHGRSSKNTVRRARELLMRSRAAVTGVAINAVDLSSPEYYGYYGYSTYAGYGSSNSESSTWSPKVDTTKSNDKGGPA
ncbi:MAG: polysaccharide biosynthesis tyrosine autokinase, partial [Bryocella sp.]